MVARILFRALLCLFVCAGLAGLPACSDGGSTDVNPASLAPDIPDLSTMTMDLSFFGLAPLASAPIEGMALKAAAIGQDNWNNAVTRVVFVQLAMYAAFEAPIGAFAAAIHSVPQRQPDGSWLWTFIFVEDDIEYSIFLFGEKVEDHTEWRMEVSSNNPAMPLDHFVWFDGEAMNDESSGHWQFYEPAPPAANAAAAVDPPGVPSIRVDWHDTAGNEHYLTITNNEQSSPDFGDTVEFTAIPLVSSIVFTDVSEPQVHSITWFPDGSGAIWVPDYNDGVPACWDTQQLDVLCTG
jgi:hypothetical protein